MVRQDAWNQDEDLLLAEVVLRHIREGGTQLSAFEEVGEKLSRTPAACGFRWNSSIRKKYESAIQLAKKQRKQLKKGNETKQVEDSVVSQLVSQEKKEDKTVLQTIEEMVQFLLEKKGELLEKEKSITLEEKSSTRLKVLLEENQALEKELTKLKHEYEIIKNDYQLMINVMERATKRTQSQI
ncbi:transcription factor, RsfA family [Evansella cellulosilytica DSM 2522]|uniref:Transcription factor, RsfA family n=1 Tax=Evansella cellulosilytica (strain ATCC 21833 / DSM 2522 / FERM P-1141 / JCM 9156 / N-4) TaxID=649639 RepID=E6TTU5_EVAC2|nr:RsfA family transcriptional regulator [Evansella cellulosilytica]ADU30864.1 transcription factor, RsfA family [Evansella cellulosilytica DSM 2522]